MRSLLKLILIIAVIAGLHAADEKIIFRPGAKPLRNELRRLIPKGMKISEAEVIMTDNGFSCKRKVNEDFLATDEDTTDSKFIQRKNFLYCEHSEPGYLASSPTRLWKVALINEAEKVRLILVSFTEVAPR